ncbi:sigma-70 family RNA polymerase sigma factor [Paenibacillus glycanilyticus]|uniref:DNA-directed RNA polymerase sigma-70 factor n=1 Tax=Paenibacillus glycanilyticus TaxID=126569 RepID=A0ABQ6GML6_9BACL|nr:sigma-70 family RNA polymerase sigma factor [Paenibacillus glycanilyticus]GLX71320.1 DNA-directed RNA polymerase sigma-70 factor [Paenibacillus glycanilyticus]
MDKDKYAAAAINGDDDALIARMQLDQRQLYGIAYSYMRNETDALEVLQETTFRVWNKRRSLRDPKLFTTWATRILIRVCLDERKKRLRELPFRNDLMERGSQVAGDHDVDRLDLAMQLKKLPSKYRMVIVLKYYRDMTIPEIAELLEKPDGTIRTWLHQALKKLRSKELQGKEAMKVEWE